MDTIQENGLRARRTPDDSEWDNMKEKIKDLYLVQDLPLEAVKCSLYEEYGFLASMRQYKKRLNLWNFMKYRIRRNEWRQILDCEDATREVLSPQETRALGKTDLNIKLPQPEKSVREMPLPPPIESSHIELLDEDFSTELPSISFCPSLEQGEDRDYDLHQPISYPPWAGDFISHEQAAKELKRDMEYLKGDVPATDSGYESRTDLNHAAQIQHLCEDPLINTSCVVAQDRDEVQTQYSIEDPVAPNLAQQYVCELSQNIYNKIRESFDVHGWKQKGGSLSELIKAFAIRIGHGSPSQANKDIMYFVHKRHGAIAHQIEKLFENDADEEPSRHRDNQQGMSVLEKMNLWNHQQETEHSFPKDNLFEGIEDLEEDLNFNVGIYQHLISESPAYQWFLKAMKNETCLKFDIAQPGIPVQNIRQTILSRLLTGKISAKRSPNTHHLTLEMKWHQPILAKLRDKLADLEKSSSIIITGTSEEAQALTLKQYLSQTWSDEWQLFTVIEKAVMADGRHLASATIDDGRLEVKIDDFRLLVTVSGSAYSVAERADQVAWIGATLLADHDEPIVYCAPSISHVALHPTKDSPQSRFEGYCKLRLATFREEHPEVNFWQNLLGQSVIITGYPIRRRPAGFSGLELPFEDLLHSVQAEQPDLERDTILLEGRQTTLTLTKYIDGVFLWHPLNYKVLTGTDTCCCHEYVDIRNRGLLSRMKTLKYGRHIITNCTGYFVSTRGPELGYKPVMDIDSWSETAAGTKENFQIDRIDSGKLPQSETSSMELMFEPCSPQLTAPDTRSFQESDCYGLQREVSSLSTTPGESIESDLLSMSSSSQFSGSPKPDDPNYHVIDTLLHRFLLMIRTVPQGYGTGDTGGSINRAPVPSAERFSVLRPQGKRPLGGHDDEDDGDDITRRPTKRNKSTVVNSLRRRFPCPYFKLDPFRYRHCCSNVLSRIRDVKLHLSRKHTPKNYCLHCLKDFADQSSLQEHRSSGECLNEDAKDPAQLEGITYEQSFRLSKKSASSLSESEQWFVIWDILFPTQLRPESVYLDDGFCSQMQQFSEYCYIYGPSTIRELIDLNPALSNYRADEDWQRHTLETVIGQGLRHLFDQWLLNLQNVSINSSMSNHEGSFADSGIAPEAGNLHLTLPQRNESNEVPQLLQAHHPPTSTDESRGEMADSNETLGQETRDFGLPEFLYDIDEFNND